MRQITDIKDMQLLLPMKDRALVPTMGALHEGHISLIRQARKESSQVVVSIFVNKLQFNNPDDFNLYPLQMKQDIEILRHEGVDILFAPTTEEMYPENFELQIVPPRFASFYEGEQRPGHFNGVMVVLSKLFLIVKPNIAYFGLKDRQQFLLAQQLVRDLNFDITIKGFPTIREENGLALSSRNQHLSTADKETASQLYSSLRFAESLIKQGETEVKIIQQQVKERLNAFSEIKLEYFAITNMTDLTALNEINQSCLLLIAATVNGVRLIDNIQITL